MNGWDVWTWIAVIVLGAGGIVVFAMAVRDLLLPPPRTPPDAP